MPELIALRAVFGQDEANHGTTRYCVDEEGLVRVPPEAVPFLTGKGGFIVAKTTAGPTLESSPRGGGSTGMVRLHHDDAGGCSYGGCAYPGDENGDVVVPAAAVAELLAHGFAPAPPTAATAPKPPSRRSGARAAKE